MRGKSSGSGKVRVLSGDQHQQAFAFQRHTRQAVRQDRFNFRLIEIAMGQSKTSKAIRSPRRGEIVSSGCQVQVSGVRKKQPTVVCHRHYKIKNNFHLKVAA